jgi:hypothetical protein
MAEAAPANAASSEEDLSAASSRLDASLLRYALLYRSRLNMLVLDREVRRLVGERHLLQLPPGITRSNLRYRAEATMQFAVELELARPDVVRWIDDDPLRRQMAIDSAYYQADRWDRTLPPVLSLPEATPALRQDEAAALADFRDYLWRFSRLEEELQVDGTAQVKSWAPPQPVSDRLKLDDADKMLRSIAQGVALRLEPAMVLENWRNAAEVCRGHAGFRPPPPELFDALLVAPRSLIGLRKDDNAPQWQFDVRGVRFQGSNDSSRNLLEKVRRHVPRIAAVGEVLAEALGTSGGTPVFAYLADGLSLIPTTPAWADVERALRTFDDYLSSEKADTPRAGPEDEMQTVADFHQILGHHVGTVERALCAAAFLSQLSHRPGSARDPVTLREALRLLALGLRFSETESRHIGNRLEQLWAAWVKAVPDGWADAGERPWEPNALSLDKLALSKATHAPDDGENEPPDPARSLSGDQKPDLRSRLAAAEYAAHRTSGRNLVAMDRPGSEAWEATRKRLAHWCNSGRLDEVALGEFCVAVRSSLPLLPQMLDPPRITLRQWSRVVVEAVTAAAMPRWMGVIALQRLGADTLSLAQQQRLLGHLEQRSHPAEPLVAETARRDGAWQPGGNALGTVVLLRKANSVLSERWTRPPTRGLVLLATVDEVERLLLHDSELFNALPRPVAVCIEGKREDATIPRGLVHRIREAVRGGDGLARLRRRWKARAPDEDFAAPVEPSTPDDLFDSSGNA